MIKKLFLGLGLIFLTGCQAPKNVPFQVLTYKEEQPLFLPVGEISIENQTVRYTELPHLETRIPVVPALALTEAFSNRFKAQFPQRDTLATIIIREADMTQKAKESGHWYILDNVEYLLTYKIDVIYTRMGNILDQQNISGWEKQALPQSSSLSQKERIWEKMINSMIQKVTDKIESDKPKSA